MIKLHNLVKESVGRTYIPVDIQPEYKQAFTFDISEFTDYINSIVYDSLGSVIFLFNGPDLGFPDEGEYKSWLVEEGLDEEVLDSITFYDKGYAFFRYCMDSGIDEESTTNMVRFMYENDINDSRDMTRDMWAKYLREYRHTDRKEVYDLLKHSDDMINIPDLMQFLKKQRNITITGGGIDECLKEVEIALKALRIPYITDAKFIY
jgi:hypothetical protein